MITLQFDTQTRIHSDPKDPGQNTYLKPQSPKVMVAIHQKKIHDIDVSGRPVGS